MNNENQSKEQPIASENTSLQHTDSCQFKINTFVSEQPPQSNPIQSIQQDSSPKALSIKDSLIIPDSMIVNQQQAKRRKYSQKQKSFNYHRVGHSRKIKTKKVTKQHLERSQYFYIGNINDPKDQGQQNHITQLLNQYQAFHDMIASTYQKRVIKLSHYGNKNSTYSNNNIQKKLYYYEGQTSQTVHQFQVGNNNNKPLSKSSVVQHCGVKMLSKSEVSQCWEKQKIEQEMQNNKGVIKLNQINNRVNKKLAQQSNLTKYTTPIRTIYLNQCQQSPHNKIHQSPQNKKFQQLYIQNQTLKCSPNHNHNINVNQYSFTPLKSERIYKKQTPQPFKSIIDKTLQNQEKQQIKQDQTRSNCRIQSVYQAKNNSNQNKLGLSVVSGKRKHDKTTAYEGNSYSMNIRQLKAGLIQNENKSQFILTQQISLPNQLLEKHKQIQQPNQPRKAFNHTISQSQSRSKSRKGLSLTQSASNIGSLNRPKIYSTKSISKINKVEKQNDPLSRKLNASSAYQSKRVEIRIY